jgi:hypothetical protein
MWNSRKVGEWIEAMTGKAVSKKQRGWEYLRKLGHSLKAPRPHHAKDDKGSRRLSKKTPDEVTRLKETYPTEKVKLWCEYEHRLSLKPIIRKARRPIREKPIVKVHQRYEWTHLYAFARPKTGEVCWVILPLSARRHSRWLWRTLPGKWERARRNVSCSCSIEQGGTRQRRS